jgi:hypothetical protein
MRFLLKILILSALFLQGCKHESELTDVGKGEIHDKGKIYKIKNVYQLIFEVHNVTPELTPLTYYHHQLIFTGSDWGTSLIVLIHSENNELTSGEFNKRSQQVKHEYNAIQMEIILSNDFVRNSLYIDPPEEEKMKLAYTKKADDIFEIELKYDDGEGDFLVKWEGPIKDKW